MTRMRASQSIAALLVLSAVLLGILVPGGPIETRNFSHINPLVLGVFNTFLTALGIASFVFAYFVLKKRRWAFIASATCGISYLLVYVLDLGKVFPVSPDEMLTALLAIEVIGTLVSLPLTYLSVKSIQVAVKANDAHKTEIPITVKHVLLLAILFLAGIGIIIFATLSAMGT